MRTYLLFTQEGIQNTTQDRLQSRADHIEREPIVHAVLVELAETRVDLESLLHDDEAVVERDVQGAPHLLGNVAEGSLAGFDLLVEFVAGFGAAAVGVEEDVAGVLHEDCAVEVWVDVLVLWVSAFEWAVGYCALRGV